MGAGGGPVQIAALKYPSKIVPYNHLALSVSVFLLYWVYVTEVLQAFLNRVVSQ